MRRSQKGQKGSQEADRSRVTRRMRMRRACRRRVTSIYIGQDGNRDEGTIRVTCGRKRVTR